MLVSQILGCGDIFQKYNLKLSSAKKLFFKLRKSFGILKGELNQEFKPLY